VKVSVPKNPRLARGTVIAKARPKSSLPVSRGHHRTLTIVRTLSLRLEKNAPFPGTRVPSDIRLHKMPRGKSRHANVASENFGQDN